MRTGDDAVGAEEPEPGVEPTTEPAPTTSAPAPPASPPPAGDSADIDGTGPVGSLAPALLRPALTSAVVVEVHADDGAEPPDEVLAHLQDFLVLATGKPVSFVRTAAPGDDRAWTHDDIVAAADAGASTLQGGGVAVVRLLFLHGTFEGEDGVLGVAVRGDVAAVFVDSIDRAAGLLGGTTGIEVAVTAHEVGHLLGLVDLVLDTGRDDPEHPGHSTNPGSVMYWAVESDLVGQLLGADPPRDLDADDRADLAAIAAGG